MAANEQGARRVSVDEYPSYGGTPTYGGTPRATPWTPRTAFMTMGSYTPSACESPASDAPARRSASLILKGAAHYVAARAAAAASRIAAGDGQQPPSGRLSDADELQAQHALHYHRDVSPRLSHASPSPLHHIPFSIAGPHVHIPEDDHLYTDVEAARAYAATVEEEAVSDHIELDLGKPVKDVHPPMRVCLKFVDVKYKVVLKEAAKWRGKVAMEKEIIHGISGSVGAGEMLAMMGPSGSGKTTFLSLLGGRKSNPQNISGSILYNNSPYTKSLKSRMGFVTQDDVLFPHLTVRETLTFSALLRLPKWLTKQQKVERAENVIAQLGLQRCRDTIIGNQFLRGVSGGERKRVCIGQEILIDPSLLFLDEPTSGLDSTTALRLILLLQNIAHEGRTVVSTIHQPSSRAFNMFDKLLLLSEGHCVYFGKARGAMTYFDSIGFAPLIPMNPADFLLDLCSGNTNDISLPSTIKQAKQQKPSTKDASVPATPSTLLAKDVKKYLAECCENQITPLEKSKAIEKRGGQSELKAAMWEQRRWETSWGDQFTILLMRGLKERRHEYLSVIRIVQVVASALLAGAIWWKSKHTTPEQLQDQRGLIFFFAVFWSYLPLFTAILTFPLERAMLVKESGANMYRLSAYFLARTVGDLPLDLILPVIFTTILYFMANLRQNALIFLFTQLTIFLTVISSQGFGLMIGAIMMDIQKATTFASICILGFMLTGGYFVQHIPPFVAWIKYFSFQAHTYNLLAQLQYHHVKLPEIGTNEGSISNTSDMDGIIKPVLAMVIMVFAYRILAYMGLRRMQVSS